MLPSDGRRQPPPEAGAAAGPAIVCGAQAVTSSRSARSQLSIGSAPAPAMCSSYARSAICSCVTGAGAAARLRVAGLTARRTRLAAVVFVVVVSFGMGRPFGGVFVTAGTRRRPGRVQGFARRRRSPPRAVMLRCAMAAADLDPARALADLRALRELTEDDRGAQRVAWTDTWAKARTWLRDRVA